MTLNQISLPISRSFSLTLPDMDTTGIRNMADVDIVTRMR